MTYHWPTQEGWLYIVVFMVAATIAGGWFGLLLMGGFFVFVSILGNLILP